MTATFADDRPTRDVRRAKAAMPRQAMRRRWAAAAFATTLMLTACNGTSVDESGPPATDGGTAAGSTADSADDSPGGGTLVLAVEQWPECLNPVTSCRNATWTLWSTLIHVLPRLMELDTKNTYVASSRPTTAPSRSHSS
ncbi:hypothetical protein [Candidatus Poriferisodalis sp.]|uniref:hypothetical protein n=1 Tax=Candidatus Poriferisodalis sp. TaxID=3101277 RepID=UPI003AF61030